MDTPYTYGIGRKLYTSCRSISFPSTFFFFFKSNEFLGHLGNEWLRKEGQSQAFWRTRDLGTVSELVDQTVVLAHQPHPFLDLSPGPRPVEEE